MALHGTIGINGETMAAWSARRTEPLEVGRTWYDYECEYRWLVDMQTVTQERWTEQHHYPDGMGVLAAKIIRAAVTWTPEVANPPPLAAALDPGVGGGREVRGE